MEHQTKPQSSQNENENENEGEARKNFTNANLTEVVATDSEQDELITVEETVVEYDVYEVIEEVTIDDDDDGDDYVEESYYSEDDYETVLNDTSSHLGNSIWKRNSSDGTNIWRRKVVASDDESADSFELRVPDLTEHMSDISFDDYNFGSPKTWSSKRSGDYSSPLSRSGSVDSLIQQQELYKDDSVDSLIIMSSSRSNDNSSSLRGRNNSSSSSKGRKISSRRQKNAMPENPLHGIEEGEFESSRTLQVQISNDDDDNNNNSENNNDHQQATVEKTPSQSTKTITSTTEKEDEDGDEETRLKKWWNKPSRKKLSKKMVLKKKNKNANVKG